jgi:hypothetical protein
MNTRLSEEAEHKAPSPDEGAVYERPGELRQGSQLSANEHETMRNPLHLPEREILRRLWRIYQMALAAAQREEQA